MKNIFLENLWSVALGVSLGSAGINPDDPRFWKIFIPTLIGVILRSKK